METYPGGDHAETCMGGDTQTPIPLSWQPPDPTATATTTTSPPRAGCHRCHCSLATLTWRGRCPSLLPSSVGGSALQIHRWQEPRPELLPPPHCLFQKDSFSLSPNYQELRTSPYHLSAVTNPQRSSCRHRVPVLAVAPTPGVIMVLPYGELSRRCLACRGTARDFLHPSCSGDPQPWRTTP